jgi:hypothetical protein
MQAHKTLLVLFVILFNLTEFHARTQTYDYIEKFRDIAISEMYRTGIPASIKMGQAILESTSGTSELASKANNHFGIKCGKNWIGKSYHKADDDYHNGLLVESCFRSYDNPEESFYDHSEFLGNPNSPRYQFLFQIDIYNYRAWAYGLKEAGYATDPNYPEKLISIIEKYELFKLVDNRDKLVAQKQRNPDSSLNQTHDLEKKNQRQVEAALADSNPKKYPHRSNSSFYIFKAGDKMDDIAARFNMDSKELYVRNRMAFDTEPLVGERLIINEYLQFEKPPKTQRKSNKDQYLFEETISVPGS